MAKKSLLNHLILYYFNIFFATPWNFFPVSSLLFAVAQTGCNQREAGQQVLHFYSVIHQLLKLLIQKSSQQKIQMYLCLEYKLWGKIPNLIIKDWSRIVGINASYLLRRLSSTLPPPSCLCATNMNVLVTQHSEAHQVPQRFLACPAATTTYVSMLHGESRLFLHTFWW